MREPIYRVRSTERIPTAQDTSTWRIVFAPAEGEVEEGLVVTVPSAVFASMDLDAPFTASDVASLERPRVP